MSITFLARTLTAAIFLVLLAPPKADAQGAVQSVRERARQAATGRAEAGSGLRGEKPKPEKWNESGTVHSLDRSAINMLTEAKVPWRVELDKKTQFKVTGEADASALQPRSAVRLEALLNKRGIAVEPIKAVTIFTPRPGFQPVVDEVIGEVASGEFSVSEGAQQPQATTLADLGIGNADEKKRTTKRTRGKKDDKAEAKRYSIVGMLISAKRGRLIVDVGKEKVRGELADDAKVTVDLANFFARPGDEITVSGDALPKEYQRGQFGVAKARRVEITLAPPQQKEDKSKGKGSTRRTLGGSDKKAGSAKR